MDLGRLLGLRRGQAAAGPNRNGGLRMNGRSPDVQFGVQIPPELSSLLAGGDGIAPRISRAEALQVPAVLRARNLIAGTLSTLPLKRITPDRRAEPWPLFDQPNPSMATSVMFALTFEDLLFEGIAWWRVLSYRWDNFPAEAEWVDHRRVHVPPAPGSGSALGVTQVTPDFPIPPLPVSGSSSVLIDGLPVDDRQVIQFLSPNPPLLVHAARAIRVALRIDRTVEMYNEEPAPLGYFTQKEGADPLEDTEIQGILDDWAVKRRQRAWGYVGGLQPNTLGWSPEQLQLRDQLDRAVLQIARAAGVDPEDLGVSTTSRTYQNSEHRRQDLLDFTLGAYVSAFQDRLSMRDCTPRGHVARVKFDGFLRSTTPTRYAAYRDGLETGALVEEEIRELEDRPPLTPAQRARLAERTGTAGQQPAAQGTGGGARNGSREAPEMSSNGSGHGNDGGALKLGALHFEADPVRVTFDDDDVAESFQVDTERRTITGLVVPWGKVARSGFSKWRFAPDSLRWSDVSRVKLNLNHDFSQLIGRATRLQSGSKGLTGTYKVARGPDGDRALNLAEDKVLDGFSIEVDFDEEKGDSWQPDPSDESVRLVRQASLRGTALTGMPAFDDARVTGVKASRTGVQMKCTKCGLEHAADAACASAPGSGTVSLEAGEFTKFMGGLAERIAESHQTLTSQLTSSIGESISAGMKAALENLHDPQNDGPQPVRAARFTVTREAPVYTLDGRGASLVRDAWYAQREHDTDAQERLRRFHKQTAEVQTLVASHVAFAAQQRINFATVTTGTAAEVIPPGYRPDLFVPQLQQDRPLVNSVARGTIANATPFTVPVFASATGMTDDHSQGNAPAEGTILFGTKTVTPGAISGKLPLTREIVDSANPAIDQIALASMRESYAQQTEVKLYTVLNGADGAGGVITSGFVPSGAQASTVNVGTDADLTGAILVRHLRGRLARYPFSRFAAPTMALMGQNATALLADAVDTTGRSLLPSIGAQNASGLGNAVTQGWSVDGLPHVPAWAMTGVAAGDSQVLQLAMPDVWVWESPVLSFRFEEKSGPQIIELALFGYFGAHVLRPVGLSGVRITAS